MMGMDVPASAVRRQLASGIDLMIHLGRLRDRRRVLLEISEIDGCVDGEVAVNPLFRFVETGVSDDGRVCGSWKRIGELHHIEKLLMAGIGYG